MPFVIDYTPAGTTGGLAVEAGRGIRENEMRDRMLKNITDATMEGFRSRRDFDRRKELGDIEFERRKKLEDLDYERKWGPGGTAAIAHGQDLNRDAARHEQDLEQDREREQARIRERATIEEERRVEAGEAGNVLERAYAASQGRVPGGAAGPPEELNRVLGELFQNPDALKAMPDQIGEAIFGETFNQATSRMGAETSQHRADLYEESLGQRAENEIADQAYNRRQQEFAERKFLHEQQMDLEGDAKGDRDPYLEAQIAAGKAPADYFTGYNTGTRASKMAILAVSAEPEVLAQLFTTGQDIGFTMTEADLGDDAGPPTAATLIRIEDLKDEVGALPSRTDDFGFAFKRMEALNAQDGIPEEIGLDIMMGMVQKAIPMANRIRNEAERVIAAGGNADEIRRRAGQQILDYFNITAEQLKRLDAFNTQLTKTTEPAGSRNGQAKKER